MTNLKARLFTYKKLNSYYSFKKMQQIMVMCKIKVLHQYRETFISKF